MAQLPITGIASSWRVPGHYMQIDFAQGPASSAVDERETLFAGALLSSGTGTANVIYEGVKNASEAETLTGPGSNSHRFARMFFKVNKNGRLSVLVCALTTGASPTAADLDVTFTTDPTANGLASVWVCGEPCQYPYDSDDTVTTVAAGIKAAINAKTHLPVTADNSSGVLTITAKQAGIVAGDGTSGSIRVHAEVKAATGISVATENGGTTDALGLGAAQTGVEGSTAQAAQLATALAVIDNTQKYYICTDAWDATSLTNLQTHITSKSLPNPGLRCVGISFFPGALAAGQTLATARNYERLQVGLCPKAENDPSEFVGWTAGVRSLEENTDPAAKLTNYNAGLLKKPWDTADWLGGQDLQDAITDGLAAFNAFAPFLRLTMNVNTRSKDPTGAVDDFRATECHRISVADRTGDQLLAKFARAFAESKFKSDKLLPDGSVDPAQKLPAKTVTPSTIAPTIIREMRDWDSAGWTQDLDGMIASLQVLRDPDNGGRAEIAYDLHVIDHLNQTTTAVSEVSTG